MEPKANFMAKRVTRIAFVDNPAVPDAEMVFYKRAIPFADLPTAPEEHAWDADAAVARVKKWAGGPDKENVDWEKYRKAFLWYDQEDPENYGSYKLPIADVIDGELKVIWRAVAAAMAVIMGARGGVDVGGDEKAIYNHLVKYYKKFDKEPPEFKSYSKEELEKLFPEMSSKNKALTFNGAYSAIESQQKLSQAYWTLQDVVASILSDEEVADKPAAIGEAIDQFKAALLGIVSGVAKEKVLDEIELLKIGRLGLDQIIKKIEESDTKDKGKEVEEMKLEELKLKVEESIKPLKDSLAEVIKKVEELEKTLGEIKPEDIEKKTEESISKTVTDALNPLKDEVKKLSERIAAIEKRAGEKKGLDGGDDPNKPKGDIVGSAIRGKKQ